MELNPGNIVGYRVATDSRDALVAEVMRYCASSERRCRYFVCLNPDTVEMVAGDSEFAVALRREDTLPPDGIGVVYASRAPGRAHQAPRDRNGRLPGRQPNPERRR